MKSNYKRLGDYIREVNVRNRDLNTTKLVGLSISKEFITSVANTIGTDMSTYKIIKAKQFACSLMQVSRDGKIPIAMLEIDSAIMSPAYPIFEVSKTKELLPEYLMMWFSRSEFDREASYYAVGGVRGSLTWEDFCNMQLPIPSIEKQKEIVSEYNILTARIKLNEHLCDKLEQTAQAIYRKWFVDDINPENLPEGWRMGTIGEFCLDMKSGSTPSRKRSNYWNSNDIPWLKTGEIHNNVIYNIEEYISNEGYKNSSTKILPKDTVLMAMYGATAGQVGYLKIETTTNQACCAMICNSLSDSAYLYFHLIFNKVEIKRMATGGAQENLSKELIQQLPIYICDNHNEKNKLATLLNKISYTTRYNILLEKTANVLLSKLSTN